MVDAIAHAALLAGATGLVGHALAAQWAGPGDLHLLVRRRLAAPGARVRVRVVDFAALTPLPAAESAFCCLGTTIKQAGSREAFRAVDFDAVLAFAHAARAAGVRRFAVVSALGAHSGSRNFYLRVKGEMEEALGTLGFEQLVIVRPSLLFGNRAALGQPARLGEVLTLALTAPLAPLIPRAWRPIAGAAVARAMVLALAQAQPGRRVIESAELLEMGQ
jgi:uncharacterized protein YbjT (DUF2867 family)